MEIFERALKDEPSEPLTRRDLFDIAAGTASEAVITRLPGAVRSSPQTAAEWRAIVANEHVALMQVASHLWRRSRPDSAFFLERARFHAKSCRQCRSRITAAETIDRVRHVAAGSLHTEPFLQAFSNWGEPAYRSAEAVELTAVVLDGERRPVVDGMALETRTVRLQRALLHREAATIEVELTGIPPEFDRAWIALSAGDDGILMPEVQVVGGNARASLRINAGIGPEENWSIHESALCVWLIMSD